MKIELAPHLTCADLELVLLRAASQMTCATRPIDLLVDCRKMEDYESGARRLFIEWNATHRRRVRGVAVVSAKESLRVVVGAMALSSGQEMRVFNDLQSAEAWIAQRD